MNAMVFALMICTYAPQPGNDGSYCRVQDGPYPSLAACEKVRDALPALFSRKAFRCAGRPTSVWVLN